MQCRRATRQQLHTTQDYSCQQNKGHVGVQRGHSPLFALNAASADEFAMLQFAVLAPLLRCAELCDSQVSDNTESLE